MILITGGTGQLGRALINSLEGDIAVPTHKELDITDSEGTAGYIRDVRPDTVIHCAAYNTVDRAEGESEACMAVNGYGTGNIARVCAETGAYLIYISTDFVFDGRRQGEYETDDPPCPLSVYGRSKLMGERETLRFPGNLVIRTAWLFSESDNNFVSAILRAARGREEIPVVCDQRGSPTYAADLAGAIKQAAELRVSGVIHVTNEGSCTRAEFAREILRQAGMPVRVREVASSEFPGAAERPMNAVISKSCLDGAGIKRLPCWEDGLKRCLINKGGHRE